MSTTRRKRPIVLTADWLDQQGACEDQAALALLYFGERATVTRTMLRECVELGLDLGWLAARILTPDQRAAYQQVRAPAWAAYQQVRAPAWAAYQQVTAPALADALGLP